MGINKIETQNKKHVFLCTGEVCSNKGAELWKHMKQRFEETDLYDKSKKGPVKRSQSSCLGVCQDGPIMVVYPEAVWYEKMTKERLEKVINDHLIKGKPLSEGRLD